MGERISEKTELTAPADGDLLAIVDVSDPVTGTTKKIQYVNLVPKTATPTADKIPVADGSGKLDGWISDADESTKGIVELANQTEVDGGSDAGKAISPDKLAGSVFGLKESEHILFDFTTDVETGEGKAYLHITPALAGMDLVYVHARVITAGTTGTLDIQIYNVTDSQDMLSTKLTVDSGETGSDTAAAPAVIDTGHDDVAENDLLRIDVDAVPTTAPKGLIVTLGFQLP